MFIFWKSNFFLPCHRRDAKKVSQRGFTYVEVILYVVILTLILTTIIPFAWNMVGVSNKSSTEQEVFSNARYVSERLKYEIRNATGINSVTTTSISLATSVPATNPTVIDLNNGYLRITQGVGSPVNLNAVDTTISSLVFTNYTSGDNKTKHIGFTFTLAARYTGKRQEFIESTTMESSAEVRSN